MDAYARMYATSDEHAIIEEELRKICGEENISLVYYRAVKGGHIPCVREFKILGEKAEVRRASARIKEEFRTELI